MLEINIPFNLTIFVISAVLISISLYMDYSDESDSCRTPLIQSANRITLILATLMFGATLTMFYAATKCEDNAGRVDWGFEYTFFILIMGSGIVACGAIMNKEANKSGCKNVKKYSPVIWGLGAAMIVAALVLFSIDIYRLRNISSVNRTYQKKTLNRNSLPRMSSRESSPAPTYRTTESDEDIPDWLQSEPSSGM